MTLHSGSRPARVFSVRAAVVAIACSVAVSARAADAVGISRTRSPHPVCVLSQARAKRTPAGRRVDATRVAHSGQVPALDGLRRPAPIQAALDVLKWSPDHVPRIEVVDVRPPRVSALAEGWIVYDVDGRPQSTIYIAGWSALYTAVLAHRLDFQFGVIRLAGVLAHERAHIEHGPNEESAYLAQLTTFERLRARDIDVANVRRALEAVRRQNRARP